MTNSAEAALQPNGGVRQEAAPAAAGSGPKRTARRRVRGFKAAAKDFALGAALPAAALIAWQSASSAGLISPAFLPSPLAILRSFARLAASEQLLHHLLISMGRAGLGFLLGAAAGLLFGLATGLFRKAEYLLDPSIQALRLVPHLALAPLIILWFGFGEASKVAIISSGAFFRFMSIPFSASATRTTSCSKWPGCSGSAPAKPSRGWCCPRRSRMC